MRGVFKTMKEQINKVIKGLNIAESIRLKAEGCTNECFFKDDKLTEQYTFKAIVKKKYIYLNVGDSGVFMVGLDGEIFNIKGYGKIDQNKKIKANLGNIKDYNTQEEFNLLLTKRYNYLR